MDHRESKPDANIRFTYMYNNAYEYARAKLSVYFCACVFVPFHFQNM